MLLSLWTEEFETGIEALDLQHKNIYKILSDFASHDSRSICRDEILQCLNNLAAICSNHYLDEEVMMEQQVYPLADFHKTLHLDFMRTLDDLRVRINANVDLEEIIIKIFEAGENWFTKHVKIEDFAFATFCHKEKLVSNPTFIGCILEVIHQNNNMLGTGVVDSIVGDVFTIRNKGQNPLAARVNDLLKLNVFSTDKGFNVWEARTISSDINQLKVTNVTQLTTGNKRTFFRVKTEIKAKLEVVDEERSMLIFDPMNLQVEVQDVSLGGLLFASDQGFELGDKIIINLELYTEKTKLECQVMRIIKDGSNFKYGCKFFDYSLRQGDTLAKFVVDHQRAMALRGR